MKVLYELFSQLMQGVPVDQPIVYLCYFFMVMVTFGAFMRFLYTLFKPW